jgi:hypothetical protein
MSTLSFHVDPLLEQRIRATALAKGVPLSRFLKESVEKSLEGSDRRGVELRGIVSGRSHLQPEDTALPPWNENDHHLT